ncbi:hypothetical protein [Aureimonas sp. ME7]|uniref:hypothetical protein n=1 Tax=Aureimonas sp. ME7 TaxID=2744252 RepID=UPI0015F6BDB4|nr:hypothetical protein [Aureimonas sp. ME7]
MECHPLFGVLAIRNAGEAGDDWVVRDAGVSLAEVVELIEAGWSVPDILMRHVMVLRSDLVAIMMLHAMAAPAPGASPAAA